MDKLYAFLVIKLKQDLKEQEFIYFQLKIMSTIKYLIIHHTGISYKNNPDQFDNVNQYHKEKWNFKSSLNFYGGYNYIMSADGKIRQYRADGEETAAVVGHNTDSLSLCLSGNFNTEQPTTTQRHNLRLWIQQKMLEYNIPPEKVVAHRKFSDTLCCGLNLPDSEIRAMAEALEADKGLEIAKISLLERLIVLLIEYVALLQNKLKLGKTSYSRCEGGRDLL